jgi:hypoxanthine phosphoribosyltransferase
MSIFSASNITPILTAAEIQEKIRELGAQITSDYADSDGELVLICILKGSFVFTADLCRSIDLPLSVEFIGVSSYGNETKSSGIVRLTQDLSTSIKGKNILVVEDIVDTGLTMKYLMENLATREPRSIRLVSLLEKPTKNTSGVEVDYLGFSIPDKFVIGFGLDFAGNYRNLPFVGVLESDG